MTQGLALYMWTVDTPLPVNKHKSTANVVLYAAFSSCSNDSAFVAAYLHVQPSSVCLQNS